MAYLYRHIRLDKNEPFYIGIGSQSDKYYRSKRITKRNKIWNDIYIKTEIRVDIVLDNISWEEACKKEIEFIKLYGRIDNKTGVLSNLTDGGEGYLNPSEEVRNKISISKSGNNNPWYGKKFSKEHCNKIALGNTGRKVSKETRKKISESQKGIPRNSEEMKKHLSKINSGSNHLHFGKQKSQLTRNKISEALTGKKLSQEHINKIKNKSRKHSKVINIVTTKIYKSIKEASKDYYLGYDTLLFKLKGKRINNTNFKLL